VQRSRRRRVRKLLDRVCYPTPDSRPYGIAVCGKLLGTHITLRSGIFAVSLNHKGCDTPDDDFGYHAAIIDRLCFGVPHHERASTYRYCRQMPSHHGLDIGPRPRRKYGKLHDRFAGSGFGKCCPRTRMQTSGRRKTNDNDIHDTSRPRYHIEPPDPSTTTNNVRHRQR